MTAIEIKEVKKSGERETDYFVSVYYTAFENGKDVDGYGNTIVSVDSKIKSREHIEFLQEEISKALPKGYTDVKIVILNFVKL